MRIENNKLPTNEEVVERGFTKTGIYYETLGKGAPVVFIHGVNNDRRAWEEHTAFFAENNFMSVCYDTRGEGKSKLLDRPYTNTEDLAELLKHVKVDPENKAILLGHSAGGNIALDTAIKYPDLVEGLILSAPAVGGFSISPSYKARLDAIAHKMLPAKKGNLKPVIDAWFNDPHSPLTSVVNKDHGQRRSRLEEMITDSIRRHISLTKEQRHIISSAYSTDTVERVSEITIPTLIIVGKEDDSHFHEMAETLYQIIKNSLLLTILNTDHFVAMEQPELIQQLSLSFIKKRVLPFSH